ncbi:MAG TPA: hypothetical protein P5572_21515 [Phycisphaerae bacterium]|nr:hypothetical protein [Phycisphaerae bacterium]
MGAGRAPASPVIVFAEDFENGNGAGWQSLASGPDVTGLWEFGDPVGTSYAGEPAQPETAAQGTGCAFTAQNPTGSASVHDVDLGRVYLISPIIDLAGASAAELSYDRWYYFRDFDEDPNDFFEVQARSSSAAPWVTLERLGTTTRYNYWEHVTVPLHEHIALTGTVQVQFIASDLYDWVGGNILEAAVDDVVVTTDGGGCADEGDCPPDEYCAPTGECIPYGNGDMDDDGDVDMGDFAAFQACFGGVAEGACAGANLAGDALIAPDDLAVLVARLDGPGGSAAGGGLAKR